MYGIHPIPPALRGRTGFACVKAHKRLFIQDLVTGELVWTHPDFVRNDNRALMDELAEKATAKGELDIRDIVDFLDKAPRVKRRLG